jgi:hypothetical protein
MVGTSPYSPNAGILAEAVQADKEKTWCEGQLQGHVRGAEK